MDDLLKQGFKAKCTFKEEDDQFLAVLEVEGISERFSTYSNTRLAAKTAAANLAQAYISSNELTSSQLYPNDVFMALDRTEEETPISMLKRLYPDFKSSFELVCTLTVGEEEFQGRGESRGIAKTIASANALESLNGVTFDTEKFENYFKKEVKNTSDIEKHPASALHEVVGQTAVFSFEEEMRGGNDWKTFICSVTIEDKQFSGVAHNKRLAKYNAAVNALKGLGIGKKFKLMSPPVANTPQPSDTGFKRRASEPVAPAPWDTPKRGRGTRGGSVSSRPLFQGLKVDTPPRFDRGRSRALGRSNSRSRGGAGYGGRGQAVGRQSTPSFPPMGSYKVEPGYGAPSDPYPGFTDSYNQGYDPGYNSGFGFSRPTPPSPVAVPRFQTARSNPYPQQMGNMEYGGYQY